MREAIGGHQWQSARNYIALRGKQLALHEHEDEVDQDEDPAAQAELRDRAQRREAVDEQGEGGGDVGDEEGA